jgi:hypothetical protein
VVFSLEASKEALTTKGCGEQGFSAILLCPGWAEGTELGQSWDRRERRRHSSTCRPALYEGK